MSTAGQGSAQGLATPGKLSVGSDALALVNRLTGVVQRTASYDVVSIIFAYTMRRWAAFMVGCYPYPAGTGSSRHSIQLWVEGAIQDDFRLCER